MPTKYQSEKGAISLVADAEHKFPIYFCEDCMAPNAPFGRVRADGRLSYCGYDGSPVCVDLGSAEDGGKVPAAAPPW